MNNERRVCQTCHATIGAGVYHACPPEEKMTEEEKDRQEFKDWWSTPHYQEVAKLGRFNGTPENWAELAWFERARREEASRQKMREELDNWIETAKQHCKNEALYRDLLDKVAEHLGQEVFTSDDGSIQDSPIRLKIPELVQKMREEMERLEVECDNQSSTIEIYQATLKECEEKVSQVESKSEELQKSFETAIDGYGKAAEKIEQLEVELASLNNHCLIMYQEGQHEHDLMEEWHQKALKLEEWQGRSMKDYLNLHVKYKQLEFDLARLRGESLESTMTEEEKFEKWWTRDGYHLDEGRFKETMKHVWSASRKEMREEIDKLNQIIEQAEEMEKEAQEKVNQVESELTKMKESAVVLKKVIGKLTEDNHGMVPNWLLDLV